MKPVQVRLAHIFSDSTLNRGTLPADIKEEAVGNAPTRRQSLDSGEFARQALKQQTQALEKQLINVLAKDTLQASPGDFSRSVNRYHEKQRHYGQIASADFLGSDVWRRVRQMQLRKLPGGDTPANQFGMLFSNNLQSRQPPFSKMLLENQHNPRYQRGGNGMDQTQRCEHLYRQRFPQSKHTHLCFVNSPAAAAFIDQNLNAARAYPGLQNPQVLAPGIVAIPCSEFMEKMHLNKLITLAGVRPSPGLVVHYTENSKEGPAVPRKSIDNIQRVAQLRAEMAAGSLKQLRQVSDSLGISALAHSDADMIADLFDALSRPDVAHRSQHNPLVDHGLQGIQMIADMLPSLATDTTRFANAHQALIEELQVVLNAARPYEVEDFSQATAGRANDAIPSTQKAAFIVPSASLFSSGMSALSQGLTCALKEGKGELTLLTHKDQETSFYFEAYAQVGWLKKRLAEEVDPMRPPVYYTSLVDSCVPHANEPEYDWTLNTMLDGIGEQLVRHGDAAEPLNVVVDTTIESEQDMKVLMDRLGSALAENRLRLFMCKSHQKFSSFGTAKVMGGSVMVIGQNNQENQRIQNQLNQAATDQQWFNNEGSQLLTHFSRAARKHEPALLNQAIANANFVVQHCFHGQDGHITAGGANDHQPFVMLHTFEDEEIHRKSLLMLDSAKDKAEFVQLKALINTTQVRTRDSFGFMESTMSRIDDMPGYQDTMVRVAFGQENHSELIERFWMLGRVMKLDHPPLSCQLMLDTVQNLVDAELPPEQRGEAMPLRDKLKLVGKNEAVTLTDQQRRQDDIATLRNTMVPTQGFTLNKVASVVAQFAYLINSSVEYRPVSVDYLSASDSDSDDEYEESRLMAAAGSDDRLVLDSLLEAFIGSGMPGVSRTGREQAVALQCALSHADMQHEDPQVRQKGIDTLLTTLQHGPLSANLAIFRHSIPDKAYQEQVPQIKQQLQNVIFGRLDPGNQLLFLQQDGSQPESTQFLLDCSAKMNSGLRAHAVANGSESWQAAVRAAMLQRNV